MINKIKMWLIKLSVAPSKRKWEERRGQVKGDSHRKRPTRSTLESFITLQGHQTPKHCPNIENRLGMCMFVSTCIRFSLDSARGPTSGQKSHWMH